MWPGLISEVRRKGERNHNKMTSIGTDIESIARFNKLDKKFFERIYTKTELSYCFKTTHPAQHLAVRYCAKEAVLKALSGMDIKGKVATPIPLNKIEIMHAPNNTPTVTLHETRLQGLNIRISLSHCEDKAIAVCIIEQ